MSPKKTRAEAIAEIASEYKVSKSRVEKAYDSKRRKMRVITLASK